jgi:hypothetical protein
MKSSTVKTEPFCSTQLRKPVFGASLNTIYILLLAATIVTGNAFTFQEVGGRVVIEAENFDQRTSAPDGRRWAVLPDEDAGDCTYRNSRNGRFIKTLPDNGGNNNTLATVHVPPTAEYKVNITTPGTYRLWLLWGGLDGSADTLYARITEIVSPGWYRYARDILGDFATGWHGLAKPDAIDFAGGEVPTVFNIPSAGIYTIHVNMREDGCAVDALILQLDSLADPVYPGPAESPVAGVYVRITGQPQDKTVATGATATFQVVADASSTPTIQWQIAAPGTTNFTDIPGANLATYTTGSLTVADNGAKYRAVVSVPGQTSNSREATLTVDVQAPTIADVIIGTGLNTLTVVYAEPVTPGPATNTANYSLDGGLTISGATAVSSNKVRLTTSIQAIGAKYTLSVSNITDLYGNTIAASTALNYTNLVNPGFLTFESYLNIAGATLDDLLLSPKYPNAPDEVLFIQPFDSRAVYTNNCLDNYGGRMSGYFVAPESADYEFFIRSDDASRLFLSTDTNAANLVQIADETTGGGPFQETGAPETSAPISLVAGNRYYIQALWKENIGVDLCQVAFRKVGDTTAAAALQPIPGAFLATVIASSKGAITLTQQPQSVTNAENKSVTLNVDATSNLSPLVFHWQKNGAPIAFTGKNLIVGPLKPSDNGVKYKAIVSVPGAVAESAEATITVTTDTTPPTILSVAGNDTFDKVTVRFSEEVTSVTATVPGNYSIPGLTISAAELVAIDKVQLTTSTQTSNTVYTLTVSNVQDTASIPNTITAPGNAKQFRSFVLTPGLVTLELWLINTSSIDALLSHPRYPGSPDIRAYLTAFDSLLAIQGGSLDNFGAQLRAYLTPTNSGSYEFFIRSDATSRLLFSLDGNPASATEIARESSCCGAFEETGAPETSAPIDLVAGTRYYIEALWGEDVFNDHCQVAWRKVGDATPAIALLPIPGSFLSTYVDQTPPSLSVARTPTGLTLTFEGTLQSADVLGGSWIDVTNSVSPQAITTIESKKFYRAKR